ncbi:MAG: hypothetical protein AAFQ87_25110, partial [Bacteroidota bacterium]
MYRVVLWTLCLFVLAPSANAQLPKGAPYAWGIVPPAHQDLQVYDRDPTYRSQIELRHERRDHGR